MAEFGSAREVDLGTDKATASCATAAPQAGVECSCCGSVQDQLLCKAEYEDNCCGIGAVIGSNNAGLVAAAAAGSRLGLLDVAAAEGAVVLMGLRVACDLGLDNIVLEIGCLQLISSSTGELLRLILLVVLFLTTLLACNFLSCTF